MLMNTSGQSCSQNEEPQSLHVVLSLRLDTGKAENCYSLELLPVTQKRQIKTSSSVLPAMPQNKIALSAVFSCTQEVKRLRNLGYSLFATALSTEAGAHPPGFTVRYNFDLITSIIKSKKYLKQQLGTNNNQFYIHFPKSSTNSYL